MIDSPDGLIDPAEFVAIKDDDEQMWIRYPSTMYFIWKNRNDVELAELRRKNRPTLYSQQFYNYGLHE